jgi:hypothetical protein
MTDCTPKSLNFSALNGKKVIGSFSGGSITSDGGLLLLREVDKRFGITNRLSKLILDRRNPSYITHTYYAMLKQRIYALAAGYEDVNDHNSLRTDPAFQAIVSREEELASASTLSRFENAVTSDDCLRMSIGLVEHFISQHKCAPTELVLDFDPTDYRLYGDQEHKHYHGYYGDYCYLPLYVFCGEHLLVAYLRPSDIDGSLHAGAILKLLVKRLRQSWPNVRIKFRGDSAFARRHILHWCEHNNVEYVVGMAQNKRILKLVAPTLDAVKTNFEATQDKQKEFISFKYAAESWNQPRKIVTKVEYNRHGSNVRCVITNLPEQNSQAVYDEHYCPRGDMENQIKQQKLDLFASRVSCQRFLANQFRVLLSAYAHLLLSSLRQVGLTDTKFANSYYATMRNKLFKIGAVVIKNTRRIQFLFSVHYTEQDLFHNLVQKLVPG